MESRLAILISTRDKMVRAEECSMMYYSFIFAFIALVTATLGFVGPAGITATVMKICFGVSFLLLTYSLGRGTKS